MDPVFLQYLTNMQGTQALQPGFDTSSMGGSPAAGGSSDMVKMLSALKQPPAERPVFSGGVTGAGLPFVQPVQNMISPALQGSTQRIAGAGAFPSLGQILSGGMR